MFDVSSTLEEGVNVPVQVTLSPEDIAAKEPF